MRHYNADTGLEGVQYEQKTGKAVCDEMKEDSYMETYIMEAANTSRCETSSGTYCSDKEKDYIKKYQHKGTSDVTAQYERLNSMSKQKGAKQSVAGYKWLAQRRAILRRLSTGEQEL